MDNELISFVCQIGECENCSGWVVVNSAGDEEACGCTCHNEDHYDNDYDEIIDETDEEEIYE